MGTVGGSGSRMITTRSWLFGHRLIHQAGEHFLLLLGVPDMADYPEIAETRFHAAGEQSAGCNHPLQFHRAPVADGNTGVANAMNQLGKGLANAAKFHFAERRLSRAQFVKV